MKRSPVSGNSADTRGEEIPAGKISGDTLKALGFANVHAEKVMAPHWERGVETGEVTAPHPHKLFLAALGGSVGTPAAGLEAEVIEVGSLDELAAKKEGGVRGKIVFFNKRMRRTADGAGYGETVPVRGPT